MRVKTLAGNEFTNACKQLALKVAQTYQPNLVVGVLTGGGYVGRELFRALPPDEQRLYSEIKIQRSGTKKKEKSWVKGVLRHLPVFVLDWLRMAESAVLERKARKNNPKREGTVCLPAEADELLKSGKARVLIVDDAIDSGATLHIVKEHLHSRYPKAQVRIAVVTVTTDSPVVDADYCLFHDRTLVRFPWSNDMKRKP